MLVVKIELHNAVTGEVSKIGQMIIANVGGTRERGSYEVRVTHDDDLNASLRNTWDEPVRTGTVEGYPRLTLPVWELVKRALMSAFPAEDKT